MVVPGLPHHVTQRGNRREAIFFEDGDQDIYCDMLAEQLRKSAVEVWTHWEGQTGHIGRDRRDVY
jgi:putative transposase